MILSTAQDGETAVRFDAINQLQGITMSFGNTSRPTKHAEYVQVFDDVMTAATLQGHQSCPFSLSLSDVPRVAVLDIGETLQITATMSPTFGSGPLTGVMSSMLTNKDSPLLRLNESHTRSASEQTAVITVKAVYATLRSSNSSIRGGTGAVRESTALVIRATGGDNLVCRSEVRPAAHPRLCLCGAHS